ncbi:hypothetical protein DFH07DRAFT_844620 [Mycena maculata]|uniref:Uncharacterized protein n=1 Tax=Mycena maculata TaxID=230809 RepID=A0AAD7I4B6_9AGAR|nr:hypothetical protein DFH07DRAFT_844620 [Mycena maculata]
MVNLVHCRLWIYYDSWSSSPGLSEISPLPHLKSLVLSAAGQTALPGLLDTLTAPALHRLRVTEALLHPDPAATLVRFLARSGCALDEFCVTGCGLPMNVYQDALPGVASITVKRTPDDKSLFELKSEGGDDENGCGEVRSCGASARKSDD